MDYRHNDNTVKIFHKDLQNGDYAWVEGELFEVTNLRSYPDETKRYSSVIRFDGRAIPGKDSYGYRHNGYVGTTFDGGTYGAGAEVMACIVRRELLPKTN